VDCGRGGSPATATPNLEEPGRVAVLAESAGHAEADLVFLGDSITYQWETVGKSTWDRYYGARRALNLGVGWEQTENVLWRIAQGHLDSLHPRLVVLMIGTNNTQHGRHSPKEIAEGVQAILDALRSRGIGSRVLLLGIFPRGREPADAFRQNNEATNRLIARLGDERAVHYRDIGAVFTRPDGSVDPEVMPDYLHLSAKGYALWAEAIEQDVRFLLGEDQQAAGRTNATEHSMQSLSHADQRTDPALREPDAARERP
jgi:hypothetical protein